MGEIIKLLKQQIDICRRLLEAVERQRRGLCEGSGAAMGKETKAIEVLLIELRHIEKRQALLLKGTATRDMTELLSRTAASEERAVARRLLKDVESLMRETQEAVAMNSALLDRHMQFILFNINVMAGTPAEATYKPAKDTGEGKKQMNADTKMFDASV